VIHTKLTAPLYARISVVTKGHMGLIGGGSSPRSTMPLSVPLSTDLVGGALTRDFFDAVSEIGRSLWPWTCAKFQQDRGAFVLIGNFPGTELRVDSTVFTEEGEQRVWREPGASSPRR
jgi:hypothetical protein